MGLLRDAYYCRLRTRGECRERLPRHDCLAIPTCITGTCVTHLPGCMPWSPTGGVIWSRWRGKRSRHMCNPQFYVSGKRLPQIHGRWLKTWYSWYYPWAGGGNRWKVENRWNQIATRYVIYSKKISYQHYDQYVIQFQQSESMACWNYIYAWKCPFIRI